MKKILKAGSAMRSMLAGLAVLTGVTAAHAHPYAGAITNYVSGGINMVSFILNESGGTVSYVTYPSGASNVLGASLPTGATNFALPTGDTSYAIYVSKVSTGLPFLTSTDTHFQVWNGGLVGRCIGVNAYPKYGDAFGRVYVGDAGTTSTDSSTPTTRQWGIYGLTPDMNSNAFFGGLSPNAVVNNTSTSGPFANDVASGNAGFGSGPFKMFVGPQDGLVWVTDATDGNANVFQFGRNFEYTNQVWSVSGRVPGEAVNQHGNVNAVAIKGSLAAGNLQIFTADNDLPVPSYLQNTNNGVLGNGGVGNFGALQTTAIGDANVIYRYDVGSAAGNGGTFPITNTPVFAATLGLNGGFPNGQVCDVGIGTDTNLIYAVFGRANYSDGNLQVFRQNDAVRVYTSLHGSSLVDATDPFNGTPTSAVSAYAGPRISPDGRYLAVFERQNIITLCSLTNGIPDESSLFYITNAIGNTGRDIAWDAADNIYAINSSTGNVLRSYSLGISTTCITSNDVTGTNGSFQLVLPPASASIANNGDTTQNYGSPTPGFFKVSLSTNVLASAVTVGFKITGSATNTVNYNITTGAIGGGITVATNAGNIGSVTFPAGTAPSGNWVANIPITATTNLVDGPTLTSTLTLTNGSTYTITPPVAATVRILNTGPQLFFISSAPSGTNMARGIPNDYAKFVITRYGDINGPGSSVGVVNPNTITLTNFTLGGTAIYGTDYNAGVQVYNGVVPLNGNNFSVSFAPGVSSVTVIVGNPVSHANVLVAPINVTIIPSLSASTSSEGYAYAVGAGTTTLNEFDNALGTAGETVLWSDPLTNSTVTTYGVTFASTNLANTNVLPVYIPNYTYTNGGEVNGVAASFGSQSNAFDVMLGFPIANENTFENQTFIQGGAYNNPPPSQAMVNNNWSTVLRLSVDKNATATPTECGLNVFPTTNKFVGNYALRFDMYLSVWSYALGNPTPGSFPRQFAAFGINTQGTNCDWRLSQASGIKTNTGNSPTNADGIWYCINAADSSLTPADFDGFASPAVPNQGAADFVSATAQSQNGVFKRPPFPTTDGVGAGTPINQWVSVSVETHNQGNVSLLIDGSTIFPTLNVTNTASATVTPATNYPVGLWTNGTPMLGYLQPYAFQSDESAFVYYSNVRVVELSPYITLQPALGLLINNSNSSFTGTNFTLTTIAAYASTNGLTNIWYTGSSVPITPFATNITTGTTMTNTVTLTGVTTATNYFSVYRDAAGSVTSLCASVEIVSSPTNTVYGAVGTTKSFTGVITAAGTAGTAGVNQTALTYIWRTNGVNIGIPGKYSGTNSITLVISNVVAADAIPTYTCFVSNASAFLNVSNTDLLPSTTNNFFTVGPITLVLQTIPSAAVVAPAIQTNVWGSTASFSVTAGGTAPFTYTWKKAGVNIANGAKYSGVNTANLSIAGVTTNDAGLYTVGVTNAAGGVLSSAGQLVVYSTSPTLSPVLNPNGSTVTLSFTSTNGFDTTNGFTLQSSPAVNGPYTNATGTFTFSGGVFTVVTPQTADTNMFYRLLHK